MFYQRFVFGACPSLRFGSACYGLRFRFGATLTLRTAHAPSACLTQQLFDVLLCFIHVLALLCLTLIFNDLQS
ncbi:MAG: hypothetical protein NZ455_08155 [Bacteroidia bacterium]|nr:hypothetical protein [Bacteroidia bacterium]